MLRGRVMTLPLPDLPVQSILAPLRQALAEGRDAVLVAPPGSGKTTLVPLALREAPWLRGRKILVLEPRRIAARAAAWRMADLLGEDPGGTVGYQVRLERRESAQTRILVLTEGLLTRRLSHDPELRDTGLVVFDEFHERSLHADVAFALCRDVQSGLRPDLRLLVMSATLNGAAVARHLVEGAVFETQGRQFPVETVFAPRPPHEPLPTQVGRVCLRALAERTGSVLAFLPGEGEIRSTARWLEEQPGRPLDVAVHPLYGMLPKQEQDAALRPAPAGHRKLVLATSVAESSLTIDGVNTVVDAGWMRTSRFSPSTGMERLETLRITRDRADQRRGRAGRLAPGTCYRLWDETADAQLAPAAVPEILTADLAATVLVLADWGATGRESVPWVTPPPEAAWQQAVALLQSIEALDAGGRITPQGRRMAALPMHPRLAHMVLRAQASGDAATACVLAALLAERVAMDGPGGMRTSNLEDLLDSLRRGDAPPSVRGRLERVQALAREWQRLVAVRTAEKPSSGGTGSLLALAFPDRVARRRGPRGELRYLLACGRGGTLRRDDPLSESEWIVVAELDDSSADAAIRLAVPLREGEVQELLRSGTTRGETLAWDRRRGGVVASEIERLGAIPVAERPDPKPDPEAVLACLCAGIRMEGLERLGWNEPARQVRARMALMHRLFPEQDWPNVSDDALANALEAWLGPSLRGLRTLEEAARVDPGMVLVAWLGPQRQRELDRLAPTHWPVPSGSRIRLDYASGDIPVLAVRIQEVFGLAESPRVAGGRSAVVLHLLSPAQRPVQVTSDLASFWRTGYAEVRKDLRGRYPRHYWPEDPTQAEPTRRVRPRA